MYPALSRQVAPHTLYIYVGLQAEDLCRLQAVTHYNDAKVLAEVSSGLGEAMVGIDCRTSNFYSYAARSE